jgi:hypothetical protein
MRAMVCPTRFVIDVDPHAGQLSCPFHGAAGGLVHGWSTQWSTRAIDSGDVRHTAKLDATAGALL